MDCLLWTCHFTWEARSEHVSNISLPQPNWIDESSKRDSSAARVLILLFKVHCLPGGTSKQKQFISVVRTEEKKHPKHRHRYTLSHQTRVSKPSWLYQLPTKNLNVGQPQSTPRISWVPQRQSHKGRQQQIPEAPLGDKIGHAACIPAGSVISASKSPYSSSSSHSKNSRCPTIPILHSPVVPLVMRQPRQGNRMWTADKPKVDHPSSRKAGRKAGVLVSFLLGEGAGKGDWW